MGEPSTDANMKYRYYSDTLSRKMLPALRRHVHKVGALQTARGLCAGKHNGWYELVVTGTLGKLVLRGCSWGYGGEGPHATRDCLVFLGIPKGEADRAAFTTPNGDVGGGAAVRSRSGKFRPANLNKEYFRLHLCAEERPYDVLLHGKVKATVWARSRDAALAESGWTTADFVAVPRLQEEVA